MADCPTCEYHKQRAQIWRDEVYRLAGHPLPRKEKSMIEDEDDDDIQEYKRPWVGLTEKEVEDYWDWEDFQCGCGRGTLLEMVRNIEAKLKEKNT